MACTTFVDCVRREPRHAMNAVLHAVGGARSGANVVIVKTDDPHIVTLARDWARAHEVRGSVERRDGVFRVRLYLLPAAFGAVPEATWQARRAA